VHLRQHIVLAKRSASINRCHIRSGLLPLRPSAKQSHSWSLSDRRGNSILAASVSQPDFRCSGCSGCRGVRYINDAGEIGIVQM
jgi:hypothetical protein